MAFFSHLPHWKSRNKCSDFTRVRPGENLGILLDVHPRNHKRLTTNIDSNNHSVIDIYGIHLSYIWVNHCRELPFAPTHPIIPTATIQEMLKAGVAGSIRINIEGLSENWQNSRLPSIAADHHVLHMYCRKKKKNYWLYIPSRIPMVGDTSRFSLCLSGQSNLRAIPPSPQLWNHKLSEHARASFRKDEGFRASGNLSFFSENRGRVPPKKVAVYIALSQ